MYVLPWMTALVQWPGWVVVTVLTLYSVTVCVLTLWSTSTVETVTVSGRDNKVRAEEGLERGVTVAIGCEEKLCA